MLDKLIDVVIHFANEIKPFEVVDQWEKGVLLRFGKYKKTVLPGLQFKIPFIDKIMTSPVITQTVNLSSQTVTSFDQRSIVLSSIVRYHIHDIQKFMLGVMHAHDVLVDTTQGVIRDVVENNNWEDLPNLGEDVQQQVNDLVQKWGITVEQVSFPDLGEIVTYRIMSDGNSVVPLTS